MTPLWRQLTDTVAKQPLITLRTTLVYTELMEYLILLIFYLTVVNMIMMITTVA